jgi:fibronectin type 3 domain-containing protein
VSFSPRSAGSVTGTLSVVSNASNSPLQIGLSGNGVAQTAEHSVSLSWSPSSSTVIGYFVYRSAGSNVSFSRLNATPDTSMAYTDDTVSNGVTYYYAVTAVDSNDVESTLSNQVSVQIP